MDKPIRQEDQLLLFKTCPKCKGYLPNTVQYFYKKINSKDKLGSCCKTCSLLRDKLRREKASWRRGKNNQPKTKITDAMRVQRNLYRARKSNLPYEYSTQDWACAIEYWRYCCAVCGKHTDLYADHWIPITDPRPDNPGTVKTNIVPLCRECNASKSNREARQWLQDKFGVEIGDQIYLRITEYLHKPAA